MFLVKNNLAYTDEYHMIRDKTKDNIEIKLEQYTFGFRDGVSGINYPDPNLSHSEYSRGYHDGSVSFNKAIELAFERISGNKT